MPSVDKIDKKALIEILDILDRLAESNAYQILQIQISRIIIMNMQKKIENLKEKLLNGKLSTVKIELLFDDKKSIDITLNYGFNFSDLMKISKNFNLSVEFLLTGIDEEV